MMTMKLGIINGWTENDFRYVKALGLEAIEFCVNHNCDSKVFLDGVNEIKGYSEKYGIVVGSMGRWGMDRRDENGDVIPSALQDDKNLIDAASILGCPVYNVGCNYCDKKSFSENCRDAVSYFKTLIDYAKDKNVKIAVYNCDWSNFVCTDREWSAVLGELPELGIKYDTSHCRGRRGDYLKEMRDWGDRIYHFHLKGTIYIDGEGYDDAPAGLDQVNWGAVMDILYTKGYNGMISIEPHSGKWQGARGDWGVRFTVNFIRPYIMPEDFEADDHGVYLP